MTYSLRDHLDGLVSRPGHPRYAATQGSAEVAAQRRHSADMVRARVGLAMNWRVLQVFLAHPHAEITLAGLQRLGCVDYRREALKWSLRALERRAFLCSRQSAREPRHYWLTDDPKVRAELALCLTYYGQPQPV
jgi:hypothetical protein